jgi:hypothetical protein
MESHMDDIVEQLRAALGGPNGLNCSGSCKVDGECICKPAYALIEEIENMRERLEDAGERLRGEDN